MIGHSIGKRSPMVRITVGQLLEDWQHGVFMWRDGHVGAHEYCLALRTPRRAHQLNTALNTPLPSLAPGDGSIKISADWRLYASGVYFTVELIETAVFTRQVHASLSDEQYRALQLQLILRPDVGDLIPGSGGLRKIRWQMPGRGKRGGARIIYYWKAAAGQIFLLFLYPKNVRSNLSPAELRTLRKLIVDDWATERPMRKDLFDELVESVKEMKGIQAGRRKPARVTRAHEVLSAESPDVATLRKSFKLSQAKFAVLLGISVDTLQNWEQHRRQPEGPARVLLRVAATHPEALLSAAHPASRPRSKRSAA
jgi:DNA-binding transcriptional regulator YiaG